MQTRKLEQSTEETWFVVQAYRKGKRGKLEAEEPKMARDRNHCVAMAERVSNTRPAVVAFKRVGDTFTGDFDEPEILATFGDVPEQLG